MAAVAAKQVEFRPSSAQSRVINSTARITVFIAGTGTGKTVAGRLWLARQVAESGRTPIASGDAPKGLVFSPTFPSYVANMIPGPIHLLERELGWGDYNKADRTLRIRPELGGGEIYFRSGEAPLAAEGIHASIGVWLDEPGQIDQDTWEVALRRAGTNKAPILLTGYPLTGGGWYKDLVDRGLSGDADILVVQGRSEDAWWADKAAIALAKATMPSWRFSMIYEGQFSRARGAVYDPLPIAPLDDETRKHLRLFGGADYGSHTAGVLIGWENETGTCWILGAHKGHDLTYAQNAAGMKAAGMDKAQRIFGDPAAKAAWPEYRPHGLRIESGTGGPGSVLAGIDRLIGMVKGGTLRAAAGAPGLADLLAEWDSYSWVTNEAGDKVGEGQVVKTNDHLLDALRYAITNSRPAGKTAGVSIGGQW